MYHQYAEGNVRIRCCLQSRKEFQLDEATRRAVSTVPPITTNFYKVVSVLCLVRAVDSGMDAYDRVGESSGTHTEPAREHVLDEIHCSKCQLAIASMSKGCMEGWRERRTGASRTEQVYIGAAQQYIIQSGRRA